MISESFALIEENFAALAPVNESHVVSSGVSPAPLAQEIRALLLVGPQVWVLSRVGDQRPKDRDRLYVLALSVFRLALTGSFTSLALRCGRSEWNFIVRLAVISRYEQHIRQPIPKPFRPRASPISIHRELPKPVAHLNLPLSRSDSRPLP